MNYSVVIKQLSFKHNFFKFLKRNLKEIIYLNKLTCLSPLVSNSDISDSH